jgi:hypothetical protein
VHAIEVADVIDHPVRVHLRMIRQGIRDRFDDDVVEADLVFVTKILELATQ